MLYSIDQSAVLKISHKSYFKVMFLLIWLGKSKKTTYKRSLDLCKSIPVWV